MLCKAQNLTDLIFLRPEDTKVSHISRVKCLNATLEFEELNAAFRLITQLRGVIDSIRI